MNQMPENEVRRVVGIVGEGYREGLQLEPEVLSPRRIIRATAGVEGPSGLLANDESVTVFEACPDEASEVVLDFGTEVVGIPELVFADGASAEVRVEYGENLHECLGEIGAPFQQDFIRFAPNAVCSVEKRRAFRFVRIRVRGTYGKVALRSFRVRSLIRPVPQLGYFYCSAPLVNSIWRTAVRTVHLCMQSYLEDGIKRDCCLWAGDLRPAALTALYAFGDADYIARNIRAFVPWRYHEGAIPPMVGHSYVMFDYVAWWTIALHDYYQYTGDAVLVRDLFPVVVDQVKFLEKRKSPRGMVDVRLEYGAPFTDWTCPIRVGEVTFLQALFCRMLQDAATLADIVEERDLAERWRAESEEVKKAANEYLWSKELGTFADFLRDGIVSSRSSEDGLALAVLFGLASGQRAAGALDRLKEKHWSEYGSLHLDRAYVEGEPDYVKTIHGNYIPPMINGYEIAAHFSQGGIADGLDLAERCFGNMIRQGATTFWEAVHLKTGTLPESTVSQCHSWTGFVAYLLQSQVLGIRPAAPGFTSCVIEPQQGPLAMISGVVPTPHGAVAARVERLFAGNERRTIVRISAPNGVAPIVILHPTGTKACVRLDGKLLFENGRWKSSQRGSEHTDNALRIPLDPGDHALVMDCVERDFSFLPKPLALNHYVKGSLKKTAEGFSFRIRGDVTNFPLTSLSPILLDGEECETYTVVIPPSDKTARRPSVEKPVLLLVGQETEVRVQHKSLKPGAHTLQFSFQTGWWHAGTITVSVEEDI